MTALVEAVLTLVARVSPSQVETVAERFHGTPGTREPWGVEGLVGTPTARAKLDELLDAWSTSGTSGDFLAGLLVGAARARQQVEAEEVLGRVDYHRSEMSVEARNTMLR